MCASFCLGVLPMMFIDNENQSILLSKLGNENVLHARTTLVILACILMKGWLCKSRALHTLCVLHWSNLEVWSIRTWVLPRSRRHSRTMCPEIGNTSGHKGAVGIRAKWGRACVCTCIFEVVVGDSVVAVKRLLYPRFYRFHHLTTWQRKV